LKQKSTREGARTLDH